MFGALAGVVLFFLVFDPRLVDPGYWIWLMEGDPATQYLGWRFFRAEPWRWPPGMIRSYGLEVGSAIVIRSPGRMPSDARASATCSMRRPNSRYVAVAPRKS